MRTETATRAKAKNRFGPKFRRRDGGAGENPETVNAACGAHKQDKRPPLTQQSSKRRHIVRAARVTYRTGAAAAGARAASNFAFDAPRKARYLSLIYRTPRGLLFSPARITDFSSRSGGTGHAFSCARAFAARSPRPRKRCPKQPRHFFTLFTIPAGCVIIPVGAIMDTRRFYGSGKILFVRVNAYAPPSAAPRLPMLRRSRLGRREIFPPRAIGFFSSAVVRFAEAAFRPESAIQPPFFWRSALTRRSRTVHAPARPRQTQGFSPFTTIGPDKSEQRRSSAFSTAPQRTPDFVVPL